MYYLFSGDSTQGRLQAGATTAITPSGQRPDIGHKARSLSRPGSSTGGGSFAHPVARSSSACFPVTKTPSAQGLAMIKTTEKTPPPTGKHRNNRNTYVNENYHFENFFLS